MVVLKRADARMTLTQVSLVSQTREATKAKTKKTMKTLMNHCMSQLAF